MYESNWLIIFIINLFKEERIVLVELKQITHESLSGILPIHRDYHQSFFVIQSVALLGLKTNNL